MEGAGDGALSRSCGSAQQAALRHRANITFERTDDPVWRCRSVQFGALDIRPMVEDLEAYGFDQGEARA
jgi:hypothetical protein